MNICAWCNGSTKNPKFCSRSCSAKANNTSGLANRRKPEGNCLICNLSISSSRKYCKTCFVIRPPRKSRTFPSGLEDPSLNPSAEGSCEICNSITHGKGRYCHSCSGKVSGKIRRDRMVKAWLSGEWSGGTDRSLSESIRKYLLEEADYCCSQCGFNTPHPDDGKTILEINHIDGNGTNHSRENLEVLCPNCHALTSSYRGRNFGNGRPVYYHRISKE